MTVTDLAQRAAPLMRNALDDEERGVHARRQPPPRTLLQHAGEAVQASGQAIIALSHVESPGPSAAGASCLPSWSPMLAPQESPGSPACSPEV